MSSAKNFDFCYIDFYTSSQNRFMEIQLKFTLYIGHRIENVAF